jgi:hypothetical protein
VLKLTGQLRIADMDCAAAPLWQVKVWEKYYFLLIVVLICSVYLKHSSYLQQPAASTVLVVFTSKGATTKSNSKSEKIINSDLLKYILFSRRKKCSTTFWKM